MAQLIPDEIDFGAYMGATEFKAKVRPASAFTDDVRFNHARKGKARSPSMWSTSIRNAIEFRPGEVTVWAGFNGHKKSMFTGQLALDLCQQRERTLMVSLEMEPWRTLERMAQQACATPAPCDSPMFDDFSRWTDGRLWMFDHVGRLTPDRAIALCRYFANDLQGSQVFIDSFMKVVQSEESMDEQKAMVGNITDVAKETGLHIHMVAHCRKPNGGGEDKPPTKYDIKGSGAISDQCHNICMVWENKVRRAEAEKAIPNEDVMAKPDAIISIEKQRNGRTEGKFGMWFAERTLRFCDDRLATVEPYPLYEDGTP